jgi:hypothetical protein
LEENCTNFKQIKDKVFKHNISDAEHTAHTCATAEVTQKIGELSHIVKTIIFKHISVFPIAKSKNRTAACARAKSEFLRLFLN